MKGFLNYFASKMIFQLLCKMIHFFATGQIKFQSNELENFMGYFFYVCNKKTQVYARNDKWPNDQRPMLMANSWKFLSLSIPP